MPEVLYQLCLCNNLILPNSMSDLAKALKFYELVAFQYYKQEIGHASRMFPTYSNSDVKQFQEQFKQLDEGEREQWFDHMFKQACNNIYYEQSLQPARQAVFLILSICFDYKLKLTKDYNFEQIIKRIWVDYRFRGREEENLRKAYEESGYRLMPVDKKNRKNSRSCGCFSNGCAIF